MLSSTSAAIIICPINTKVAEIYTVSQKKQATLLFAVTSPPVQIFLQFLKHFVQE